MRAPHRQLRRRRHLRRRSDGTFTCTCNTGFSGDGRHVRQRRRVLLQATSPCNGTATCADTFRWLRLHLPDGLRLRRMTCATSTSAWARRAPTRRCAPTRRPATCAAAPPVTWRRLPQLRRHRRVRRRRETVPLAQAIATNTPGSFGCSCPTGTSYGPTAAPATRATSIFPPSFTRGAGTGGTTGNGRLHHAEHLPVAPERRRQPVQHSQRARSKRQRLRRLEPVRHAVGHGCLHRQPVPDEALLRRVRRGATLATASAKRCACTPSLRTSTSRSSFTRGRREGGGFSYDRYQGRGRAVRLGRRQLPVRWLHAHVRLQMGRRQGPRRPKPDLRRRSSCSPRRLRRLRHRRPASTSRAAIVAIARPSRAAAATSCANDKERVRRAHRRLQLSQREMCQRQSRLPLRVHSARHPPRPPAPSATLNCVAGCAACDAHATCLAGPPGVTGCVCNSGYPGNGTTCTLRDPCTDVEAPVAFTFPTFAAELPSGLLSVADCITADVCLARDYLYPLFNARYEYGEDSGIVALSPMGSSGRPALAPRKVIRAASRASSGQRFRLRSVAGADYCLLIGGAVAANEPGLLYDVHFNSWDSAGPGDFAYVRTPFGYVDFSGGPPRSPRPASPLRVLRRRGSGCARTADRRAARARTAITRRPAVSAPETVGCTVNDCDASATCVATDLSGGTAANARRSTSFIRRSATATTASRPTSASPGVSAMACSTPASTTTPTRSTIAPRQPQARRFGRLAHAAPRRVVSSSAAGAQSGHDYDFDDSITAPRTCLAIDRSGGARWDVQFTRWDDPQTGGGFAYRRFIEVPPATACPN